MVFIVEMQEVKLHFRNLLCESICGNSLALLALSKVTSCFAASVGSPCSMSPSLSHSGVNHDLILCTECTMIYGLVVSFFKLQYACDGHVSWTVPL